MKVITSGDGFIYQVKLEDIAGFKIDDDGKYILFCHDQHETEYDLEFDSWVDGARTWLRYLKGIK